MPTPLPPVTPADLPADALITYDQFKHLMGPNPPLRATIEKYVMLGTFEIAGVRLSPKKPVVFRAGAVAQMLQDRMAGLEVSK